MAANVFDNEIMQYLPLLGNDDKMSLLQSIRKILHISTTVTSDIDKKGNLSSIDYSKYSLPISKMKFDRGEINER